MFMYVTNVFAAPPGKTSSVEPQRAFKPKLKPLSRPYQVGTASWYGKDFHGRQTASGEPYDMYQLTAAHRTLPLGTWVRVTNLRNNRWVLVRINDRGPVPEDRIIDLSFTAAQVLDMEDRGLARVSVEIIGSHESRAADPTIAEERSLGR